MSRVAHPQITEGDIDRLQNFTVWDAGGHSIRRLGLGGYFMLSLGRDMLWDTG